MNGPQVLVFLLCLGTVLAGIFAFEVAIFRIACGLCRVPRPGFFRTLGIVSVLLVVPAVVDAIFGGVLYEVYSAAGFPIWEAGIVQFFLALPVHMAICSTIHAKMMDVRVTQGLGVWLVEKFLKLILAVGLVAVVGLIVLVGRP